MWFKRHWRTVVAVLAPFSERLWHLVSFLVARGGDIDFIISRLKDPDWVGAMLDALSPTWTTAGLIVVGGALIWWDVRRSRLVPATLAFPSSAVANASEKLEAPSVAESPTEPSKGPIPKGGLNFLRDVGALAEHLLDYRPYDPAYVYTLGKLRERQHLAYFDDEMAQALRDFIHFCETAMSQYKRYETREEEEKIKRGIRESSHKLATLLGFPIKTRQPSPAASDEYLYVPRKEGVRLSPLMNADKLFDLARTQRKVIVHFKTALNDETAAYASQVTALLENVAQPGDMPNLETLDMRNELRKLLALLKGNDVWVYAADHFKRLPERWEQPKTPDPYDGEQQLIVAFGPADKNGEAEAAVEVEVDNGQPRRISTDPRKYAP